MDHDHTSLPAGAPAPAAAARPARRALRIVGVAAALAALGVASPGHDDGAQAASAKITICHRTHATTNPYRRITVSQSAVQPGRHGGHDLPNGSSNPAVYDPTFTYAANNKYWEDIIPGATNGGSAYNGSNSIAMNWTAAGQAVFYGASCPAMSAKQFYDAEIAAGVPQADVLADLNDQAANEDKALLTALGGSFDSSNLAAWETAVSVTTNAASSVTTTGAVLNGILDLASVTAVSGFQWGTDPNLATFTSTTATPSTATGSEYISRTLSGLSPNTTYYFRATGTTDAGLDTEGVLYGAILSFTTPDVPATTTTTTEPATTTTTTTTEPATTTTTTTTEPATTTTTTEPATTTTTTEPATTTTTTEPATTTTTTTTTVAPGTTTTTVAPSTTTSTTVPGPGTSTTSTTVKVTAGSIEGLVWFDSDQDDQPDDGEAVFSDTDVALRRHGHGGSALRTARTDSAGRYQFTGLEPGDYDVAATVPADGIDPTYDTDGTVDWNVSVGVTNNAPSIADFAGVGRGSVTGHVVDTSGVIQQSTADLECTWAGADGTLGTADDSVFATTSASDGSFTVDGVPYGSFQCATVSSSGVSATPIALAVNSNAPVSVNVPTVTPAAGSSNLPTAGANVSAIVSTALVLLVVGSGLFVLGKARS